MPSSGGVETNHIDIYCPSFLIKNVGNESLPKYDSDQHFYLLSRNSGVLLVMAGGKEGVK